MAKDGPESKASIPIIIQTCSLFKRVEINGLMYHEDAHPPSTERLDPEQRILNSRNSGFSSGFFSRTLFQGASVKDSFKDPLVKKTM